MRGVARFQGGSTTGSGNAITLSGSLVYAGDMFHACRALGPAQLSRAYFWFMRGGTLYVVDFTHQGQGADPRVWNPSLATATRISVTLASGTRTSTEVAIAVVAALAAAGITTVTRVANRIVIAGASGMTVAPDMTTNEALRGIWGAQRSNFGGAPSTPPSFTPVNGTVGVHVTSQATAGRALGMIFISSSGARTGNLRMCVTPGPAYSLTPGTMFNGSEALGTRNVDFYIAWFTEPLAVAGSSDIWMLYRTDAAAGFNAAVRPHGSTPTGNGDLTVGQQIFIDTTVSNPATPIFTSGSYTPVVALNVATYAAVAYIYEVPTAGFYVGSGNIRTLIGFHGAWNTGTPSTTGPTILDGLGDTPRQPMPWGDGTIVGGRQAAAAISATEDFGFSFYDLSATNPTIYPLNAAAPLLGNVGAINASVGPGYKLFTCNIPFSGVSQIGMFSNGGNRDGSIPATTITIAFTAAGPALAWLDGWVDNGREWDDMVPERGGYGNNAQYLTLPGGMPAGNPSFVAPATFQTAPPAGGPVDTTALNHPRVAWEISRQGMLAA